MPPQGPQGKRYSPENPFAPKGGSVPYSPDNPFAPKASSDTGDIALGANGNTPDGAAFRSDARLTGATALPPLTPPPIAPRDATARAVPAGTVLPNTFVPQLAAAGLDIAHAARHPYDTGKQIARSMVTDAGHAFLAPVIGDRNDPDPRTGRLPYPHLPVGAVVSQANTPGALTASEHTRASVNTAANSGLGLPTAVGRVATMAALGAYNAPDEPIRGAVGGAALGEMLHLGISGTTAGVRGAAPYAQAAARGGASLIGDAAGRVADAAGRASDRARSIFGGNTAELDALATEYGLTPADLQHVRQYAKDFGLSLTDAAKAHEGIGTATNPAKIAQSRTETFAKARAEEEAGMTPEQRAERQAQRSAERYGPAAKPPAQTPFETIDIGGRTADQLTPEERTAARARLVEGRRAAQGYAEAAARGELPPGVLGTAESFTAHLQAVERDLDRLRSTKAPSERPAISSNDAQAERPGIVHQLPVDQIAVDPERFQFKLNTDEQGVGRELKSVSTFNPALAGVLSVWRDPATGQVNIVNGHHRLELAKRTGQPTVNVQYLDARTAPEARAQGALINIAEGRGTALDAAKFFRDTGLQPDALSAQGVSLTGAIAKHGVALSKLAPDVFDRVATGKISEGHGAIIGAGLPDSPAMQRAAASLVENSPRTLGSAQVQELVGQVRNAGEANVSQESLFGTDQQATSLMYHRADLAAEIKRRLSADRRLFGFVSKEGRAEALQKGGNSINVNTSAQLAEQAAILEEVFGKEAHASGDVGRLITHAAQRVATGEKVKAVAADIYEPVRQAVSEALARRGAARGTALENGVGAGESPAGYEAAGRSPADAEGADAGPVRDSTDPAQGGLLSPSPRRSARSVRALATFAGRTDARMADLLGEVAYRMEHHGLDWREALEGVAEDDFARDNVYTPEHLAEATRLLRAGDTHTLGSPATPENESVRRSVLDGLSPEDRQFIENDPQARAMFDAEDAARQVRTGHETPDAYSPDNPFAPARDGIDPTRQRLEEMTPAEWRDKTPAEIVTEVRKALKPDALDIAPTADGGQEGESGRLLASPSRAGGDMLEKYAIEVDGKHYTAPTIEGAYLRAMKARGLTAEQVWAKINEGSAQVGFLTSHDRFVSGYEAAKIAVEAKQIHGNHPIARAIRSGMLPIDVARRPETLDSITRALTKRTREGMEIRTRAGEAQDEFAALREGRSVEGTITPEGVTRHGDLAHRPLNELPQPNDQTPIPVLRFKHMHPDRALAGKMFEVNPADDLSEGTHLQGKEYGPHEYTLGYWTEKDGFMTADQAGEKYGSADMDIGPKGRRQTGQSGFELFNPEQKGNDAYGRDLFGNELGPEEPGQGSLFGGKEGTAESRSLSEHEAAARSELVKLRQMLALEGDAAARSKIAAQIAELDKLVNRDAKISPEELAARAAATADANGQPIAGPDQGMLFSPLTTGGPIPSPMASALRKVLGIKSLNHGLVQDVKAVSDISRQLAEAVGVPLRQGRGNFARLRALGWFHTKSEVIRVRRLKQISTVAHEVGHYLSKKYDLKTGVQSIADRQTRLAMGKELLGAGKRLYGSRKPAGGYAEEGVAEFFKFYVSEPARALAEFPLFSQHVDALLANEPALSDALMTARNDFARFDAAPASEKVAAMVSVSQKGRALPTVRQVVSGWFDDLHEIKKAVEEMGGEDDPAKNAYVLARLTRGSSGIAADMLEHGVLDFTTRKPVTRGFADILSEVGREHLQAFREYLVAARTVELADRGIDAGVDLPAAKAVAAAGHAQFLEPARKLYWYQDALLKYGADAGLMTADEYAAIRKANPNRVPFFRVIDESTTAASGGHGGGMARNSSGVFRIKGSDLPIIDPLESIVGETYRMVDRANKHFAAQTLVTMALDKQGGGRWVELLSETPKDRVHLSIPEVLSQLHAMGFTLPATMSNAQILALHEGLTAFHQKSHGGLAEAKDLVMPVLVGGERKWVAVKDRAMWDALQTLGVEAQPAWAKILEVPARVLRRGAVLSPEFIPVNPIRDAFHLAVFSKGPTAIPFSHLVEGIFHYAKQDGLYAAWVRSGGENSGMVGYDRADVRKALAHMTDPAHRKLYRIVKHPWDALGMLSQAMESATRLGEFASVQRASLRAGMPERSANMAASLAARSGTLDFASGGKYSRNTNRIVAFFNANVLGAKQFADAHNPALLKTAEGRTALLKTMGRGAAFITLPSMALYLAQKDDPAYQDMPEYVKATGWVWVQRGDDGNVKHIWWVPRPQLLGYAYGYLPEKALDFIRKADPKALHNMAARLVDEASPPVIPTAMRPLLENWGNRSTLTGRPIVPASVTALPASEQSTRYTGETARAVGSLLDYSPAKLENAVSGYAGGVGRYGLLATDKAIREARALTGRRPLKQPTPGEADPFEHVPGLRRFTQSEPGSNAASVSRLYDAFEDAESKRREWRRLLDRGEQGAARRYFDSNRDAIVSVATSEESGGEPGVLRQYQAALGELAAARRKITDAGRDDSATVAKVQDVERTMVRMARSYWEHEQHRARPSQAAQVGGH